MSTIPVAGVAIATNGQQANHAHTCQASDGKLYTLIQNGDNLELHSYDPQTNTDAMVLSFLNDLSVTLQGGYTFNNSKYGLGGSIFFVVVQGEPTLCCYVPLETNQADKAYIFRFNIPLTALPKSHLN